MLFDNFSKLKRKEISKKQKIKTKDDSVDKF